ncbi:hypothetical protein BABINDRAFT_162075 [Babjeviella inositovora NRRL Y-12698]|uniref:UBX domain-containing protein n=1 Tax=Babjeviella inositovora NRRL Y-12698 TaxID=984486 RepID=A0A1E3QMP8_9ASCO|nr:uncharacterized protein BABINDRAFT_162075 [Babjeviella inositovora NRRL Y-12698]ODQ78996.1 hypothetical protein BABINDRAFT_162075 [Babjeviella inositovora NRRL Y-12698]
MSDQEDIIKQFTGLTNSDRATAETFLAAHDYDLMDAIDGFFKQPSASTPQPSAPRRAQAANFGSFSQLNKSSSNESEDDDDTNFFTGGEKSALQVENPNAQSRKDTRNLVQDLLKKAAAPQGAHPDETPTQSFSGTGYKLGDATTESQTIRDVRARPQEGRVSRQITFWRDGFQVGDGALYRYDNPANASYLNTLNQGRAPLDLLDVKFGQDVDVNVTKKLDEDYVAPKSVVAGFSGSGHKLGSIVPGESPQPEEPQAAVLVTKPQTQGEGDSQVQIRLANGRRVVHRFNSTDPVSEVYAFVAANTDGTRAFVLSHAFPVKPIDNSSLTIEEAGLVNAVVVQRWK